MLQMHWMGAANGLVKHFLYKQSTPQMYRSETPFTHEYTPGWVLPYLGMVGRFSGDDPILGIFNPIGSLFYTSPQSD